MSLADFDAKKFFLGILCNHRHAWNDGHQSLRYIKNRTCVQCTKEYSLKISEKNKAKCKEWYEQNKAKHHEYTKNYVKTHHTQRLAIQARYREKNRDMLRERSKDYTERNSAIINARHRLKYKENPAVKQRLRVYYQNQHGRLVQSRNRQKRRALVRSTHHWHYTKEQIQALFDKFDNICAYCGTKTKLTIDHWIALSVGGTDVISNLVPCCSTCNCSKFNNPGKQWYENQSFYTKKRWNRIVKLLGIEVTNGQILFF